jgi:thiol:disulfide interchange protein DsbA
MFRLISCLAGFLFAVSAVQGAVTPSIYVEGQHYLRLAQPERAAETPQPKAKAEVAEVFWYGCPHCNAFEPKLEAWLKNKPADVQFLRVPAVLNPNWQVHARTYYALELMGQLEKMHPLIFAGIHEQNRRLSDEDSMAEFLAMQGVDEKKFREAYESLPVNLSLDHANALLTRYRLDGVPAMIVNGTYLTTAALAGGYDQMLSVVNYLIALKSESAKAADSSSETTPPSVKPGSSK